MIDEIGPAAREKGAEGSDARSPLIARRGRGYHILPGGTGRRRFGALPYALVYVFALGTLWTGVTTRAAACFCIFYALRVLGVTVAYHRYFSHRSFSTSRAFQFVLGVLAETTLQKGILWYASHHRHHHRHSDTELDLHSPRQRGFWYAHLLWIFDNTTETDYRHIKDLSRYPELRWLDRYWVLPPALLAVVALAWGGLPALCFGFFANTVVVWHVTYSINSVAHRFGRRRFETSDDSRNNGVLGLLMFGEGWHNNHHHCMRSVRLGLRWWEIDIGYYVIRLLAALGIVWDLREPPPELLGQKTKG